MRTRIDDNSSTGGLNLSYDAVSAEFNIANANGPYYSQYSAWTGLGGAMGCALNGQLIQSGAALKIDSYGNKQVYMWVENAPQGYYQATNYVAPGDTIFSYNSNMSGAYAYVYDVTQGTAFSSYNAPGFDTNTYDSQCSADFIVEGQTPSGWYVPNFGTVTIWSTYWHAAYGVSGNVGSADHDYYVMCNGSWADWLDPCSYGGYVNVNPGPISSDGSSFNLYFDHS